MNKIKASQLSIIACYALMFYTAFIFFPKWEKHAGESALGWDACTYYWYLPSVFIYKDLKHQQFGDSIIKKYQFTPDFSQSYPIENGNRVIGYSSGLAVMYLPFFAIGHILANPLGYPADGFSLPYQTSVQLGSLLIALIGIWYFRKLLLLYFEDKIVAVVLFILVFGTNYLNYSAIAGTLTHNWLFTLYVFLLLNTHYFYRTFSAKYAIRIGLLIGLAVLTRPSEIIAVLIPLLWSMESISPNAIKQRFNFLWQQRNKVLIVTVCAVAVGSIQVIYWLYIAGKPFVYSYRNQGFSWMHPHFRDYTLSYKSGWLTYTPMVILMFIGIIPFLKTGKNKVVILSFFLLNLYIVSAWDIWWYGGTGGRAMIQSYPVILFPLAALVQWMVQRKIRTWILCPFILLFTYFNLWFTWDAHAGMYDPEGMSKAYYWATVFRFNVSDDTEKLKDTDELFKGKPKQMRLLYENGFENDTLFNPDIPPVEGKRSLFIKAQVSTPHYAFDYTSDGADWIRTQAAFKCLQKQWSGWKMLQMVVRLKYNDSLVKERMIRVDRYLYPGAVKDIFIDVRLPKEQINKIDIFFWNEVNDQAMVADNLRVWSFKVHENIPHFRLLY